MAKVKLVCSDCGADVSQGDITCSRCGAALDDGAERERAVRPCEMCGFENRHAGNHCESCGSKLKPLEGSRVPGRPGEAQSIRRQQPKKSASDPRRRSPSGAVEPWQIVSFVAVAGLIVFFVYIEVTRPGGASSVEQAPKTGVLGKQQAFDIDPALEGQQKVVDANPNDAAALLKLANMLHDAAQQDGRLWMRSIENYKKYLSMKPTDPDARVDLGICYFEMGKLDSAHARSLFDQAIKEMELSFKGYPKHQQSAFNLGIVHLYAGNIAASNLWFKRTIEINAESDLGKRAKGILEQHSFQ